MSSKKFWYTAAIVFALTCVWRWAASYWAGWLWNPAANWTVGWWLWGASFAWIWTWVFSKGYENGGLWEGLRYGLFVGALMYLPHFMGNWNAEYAIMTLVWSLVATVFYGLATGLIWTWADKMNDKVNMSTA